MGSEKTEPGAMSCVNDLMSAVAPGDRREREMNTAEVLVKCLENEGVKYIFGIPGKKIWKS